MVAKKRTKQKNKLILTPSMQDALYDGVIGAYNLLIDDGVIKPSVDQLYRDVKLDDVMEAVFAAFVLACERAYMSKP